MTSLRRVLGSALDAPRAPWVIIALGFAIRLVALGLLASTPLNGDGLSYHETAQAIASGVPYEPHWPPGLPYFLALAYRVSDRMVVGRAMMLVVYAAFCALVLTVGRRVGGPRTANTALAVFAVTPIFVWASVTPLTQLFSATLALAVVAFADQCLRQPNWRYSTLLGVSLAWLLMTRPSNASIAVAIPAYVFWRTRRARTLAIPFAIVAITVGAWSMKAYGMTGRTVFVNDANSQNVFYGNNPWTPTYRTWWFGSRHREDGDKIDPAYEKAFKEITDQPLEKRDALFVSRALDHIKDRPDLFLVRTASRVRTFAAFETYTSAQVEHVSPLLGAATLALDASLYLLIVGAAILLPALRMAGTETVRLMLGVAVLYALPYFVVFSHPTFHFTDVPLIGLLGAAVLARVLESGFGPLWSALSRRGRIAVIAGYVAFFLIQLEWVVDIITRPRR